MAYEPVSINPIDRSRYNIPGSFCEAEYIKGDRSWNIEATYFEQKLTFKIDATTGNVSGFRIEKIAR